MRLSFTDIRQEHYRAIQLAKPDGTPNTDAVIDANFNLHLGQRYQTILAKMNNYKTVKPYSLTTSSNQQVYPFPPGLVTIEGGWIQVGSVKFPLQPINSRFNFEQLNAILIQASALPQFYFVEQDSFQIWPIPQAAYTGTIYYHFRDRNLSVNDVTSGTITLTNGSNIISNSVANFTGSMIGRWLTVTDPAVQGQGYWYRVVGFTDTTHITLGANNGTPVNWGYPTATPVSYRIGETPELPEEMHQLLIFGTVSDYFGLLQKNPEAAKQFDNAFWTGSYDNPSRDWNDSKIAGGLIGAINLYKDRDSRTIIRRRPKLNPLQYKVWATSLS